MAGSGFRTPDDVTWPKGAEEIATDPALQVEMLDPRWSLSAVGPRVASPTDANAPLDLRVPT